MELYFDTDSSEVKSESAAALEEIAKLLGEKSTLKLYVVGHTDDTGDLNHNINLSRDRARAVIDVLISQYKIDAGRLVPFGVGPFAPVSSNLNVKGKEKNRRVELVRRL